MSTERSDDVAADLEYDLDDWPGLGKSVIFGAQHVVVMFTAMIAEPIVIGAQLNLPAGQIQWMLSATMLGCGIGAILQTHRIGFMGAGLPLVMGSFLLFIGPIVSTAKTAGLAAAFTGVLLAAIVQWLLLSWLIGRIARFFPPLVIGTTVTIIGLYLLPIGTAFVVGADTPHAGEPMTFLLAGITLALIVVMNQFTRGFAKMASLLIAIAIGYLIAALVGHVDFGPLQSADWFGVPHLFPFGAPSWPGTVPFLIFLLCFLITAVDVIGVTVAVTGMLGIQATKQRFRGAVAADGAASALSSVFGGSPLISYSQNVGIIKVTGVASRHVVTVGGGLLILMAFSPKFGQALAIIPKPVLGVALMVAWGLVIAVGTQLVRSVINNDRDMFIYAVSVAIGMVAVLMPDDVLATLPESVKLLFESGPSLGILLAVVLNLVIPRRDAASAPTKES